MANSALSKNPYFNGEAAQQPATSPYGSQFNVNTNGQQGGNPYGQQPYGQQATQQGQPYGQPAQPFGQGQQYGQNQQYGQPAQQFDVPAPTPGQLNQQYDLPSPTADERDRMTYEDVIAKSAGLFGAVIVAAVLAWILGDPGSSTAGYWSSRMSVLMITVVAAAIGTFILSLVLSFSKKPRPALTWCFAIGEGWLAGGFSAMIETLYPGLIIQALIGTVAVIAVTLVLFINKKVRTSSKMNKIVLVSLLGLFVFSILNAVLMATGVTTGPFGMRSIEVFGIPLGVILGLFAVFLGAYMLVSDFEFVRNGVESGAPRAFGWTAGFALVSTVVYIYIEILRILAILASSRN